MCYASSQDSASKDKEPMNARREIGIYYLTYWNYRIALIAGVASLGIVQLGIAWPGKGTGVPRGLQTRRDCCCSGDLVGSIPTPALQRWPSRHGKSGLSNHKAQRRR